MKHQTGFNVLRETLAIVFIGLFPLFSWGQANLVPNPSFEQANPCPGVGGNTGWVTHWFAPEEGNTPDYWSECAVSGSIVPDIVFGFQYANTGGGYLGLYTFTTDVPDGREAISVELTSALLPEKKYVFRAYFSLADIMLYSTRTLGYKLSLEPLTGPPQIVDYEPTYYNTPARASLPPKRATCVERSTNSLRQRRTGVTDLLIKPLNICI